MSFIWLLFAHYIGDIALQSDWQAQNKSKYWYVMFSHAMIWTAVVCVALAYIGRFEYWKVAMLLFGHIAMDEWKSHQPHERKVWVNDWSNPKPGYDTKHEVVKSNWWMIYPDQAFHIIQLVVTYVVV